MKFRKAPALTVALLVLFSFTAYGQTGKGYLDYKSYYYDFKLVNPAFAGITDKHVITAVYSGFPSIQSSYVDREISMFYGTYETSIPSIKSGVGALAAYDESGIINTFQSSIFFNRKFSFNDRAGLRVGTRLTYLQTEIDYSLYPWAKDDPFLADRGPETVNRFNFDLGVLYYSPIVNVGLSVRDVIKEEYFILYEQVWSTTSFNVIVTREFDIRERLKITPSVVYTTDFEDDRFAINSIFEIRRWLLLGGSYVIVEGENNISFSAGVNIKEWVQIIGHVYSSSIDDHRDRTGPRVEAMVRVNIPHSKAKE